jgi:hypothetical protein
VVPPLAVKVVEVPLQIGFAEGVMLTVGLEFTLTVIFAVPVHPEVVPVTV